MNLPKYYIKLLFKWCSAWPMCGDSVLGLPILIQHGYDSIVVLAETLLKWKHEDDCMVVVLVLNQIFIIASIFVVTLIFRPTINTLNINEQV